MATVSGKINKIDQRKDEEGKDKFYIVEINNMKFSAFGTCPYKEGEDVTFDFEVKGKFNNIVQKKEKKTFKASPSGIGQGPPYEDYSIRQEKIRVGQAANMALKVSLNDINHIRTTGAQTSFNWIKLSDDTKQFYDFLKNIEKDLIGDKK